MKVSFVKLPDAKLFNGLFVLRIGFDFGTHHAHAKEVPVSNPITLRNFVRKLVLKSSEPDLT